MGKWLNVGGIILCCLLAAVVYSDQVYAAKIIDGLEILAEDWVENVTPLPMNTSPIEKYYAHRQENFFIEKLALSPAEDKIAFAVNQNSIWTVRCDGTGLACLVCESKPADSPEWSRDGKEIIFMSGEGGRGKWFGSETLIGIAPDGTRKRTIGVFDIEKPFPPPYPLWRYSPDGQYMVLWKSVPRPGKGNYGLTDTYIHLVRVKDGRSVANLKTTSSIFNIQWFPNGEEVLIEALGGRISGDSSLFFLSITGGKRVIDPDVHQGMRPAIHPSGQLIACCDDYILHFVSKDGTKNYQILKSQNSIGYMIWTARGDRLVFSLGNKIYFLKLKKQVP